jgi:signal transduction histidine kinase
LDTTLWIVVGLAAAVIVVYLVTMRVFFRQSRDADKKIDLSKVREWKDED